MTNSLVHNDGTVAVTANSDQVVGTLTGWEFGLVKAGIFSVAGYAIPIYSVEDDTHLTLAYPYPGPTVSGRSYAIALDTTDGARRAGTWTVQRLGDLARTPWGVGVIPDGRGTLAQRDALDPMPTDNYCWLRVEIDEPLEFYFRVAGQWVGPYELRGEASDVPGPPGAAGTGFILRGEYDNLTLYNKNDTVWFGDYTFASKVDSNTGNEPPSTPTDDANWQYVPTVQGLKGDPGDNAYVYVAYASDDTGTDFTLTFDPALNYIAILATTIEIPAPAVGDFAGLWKNYKGSQGLPGLNGGKGWSPAFAIVNDVNRRVLQVSDWVGGEGAKPATGDYVGAAGLTPTIGDAIDIRGPAGSGTGDVTTSGSVSADRIVTYADATGDVIKDSGSSVADVLNRANHTGTQSLSTISDAGTAASKNTGTATGNVPILNADGKLDTSVIPAVAITDIFVVNTQSAMLALDAQRGDIAIRTDLNKSFVLQTDSPSTLADWKELLTPTDAVLSVAGLTGAITASALKVALAIAQGDVSGLTTASSPQFAGVNIGHASDSTLTRLAAGVLAIEGKRIADLSTENQPLTGGATVTSKALGTVTTGTLTLDAGDCPLQHYTANGAHTFAPGAVNGSCLVDITNGASAGVITTSGWTKVAGDPFTTTNGHKFRCHCSIGNGGSLLIVQALQ